MVWAPEVLEEASNHGLTLLESGQLVNTREGEEVPEGIPPVIPVSKTGLTFYSRNTIIDASKFVVKRPAKWAHRETELIGRGSNAVIRERPGFEVRRVQWGNGDEIPWRVSNLDTVLISNTGSVVLSGGESVGPGDVALIQAGEEEIDVKPLPGGVSEIFVGTGTADLGVGMGASWGDNDRDGRQDLYVTNMYSRAGRRITALLGATVFAPLARGNSLFRNLGGQFDRVSGLGNPALLVERGGWGWGSQFADLNNDGFLDIYALSGFYTAPEEVAIIEDT